MTTRSSQFLKAIYDRLDLPQPSRSRVLLEIAADLEDLEKHLRGEGLSAAEARRRAIELCDLSDEALSQMVAVHAGGYRRFLERLGSQARTWWERLFLSAILVFVLAATGPLVLASPLIATAGPAVWPILGAILAALLLTIPKFYAAYLRQNHDPRRLRARLSLVPGLAAVNLCVGVYGFWMGLYLIAGRIADDHDRSGALLVEWMLRCSAMLVVCLLSVLLILALWFVLVNKIARIERAEAMAHLSSGSTSNRKGDS